MIIQVFRKGIGRKLIQFLEKDNVDRDARSVRLDVYVKDDKGVVYDIEMQIINTKELPKRSRYYQSMIDLQLIDKGQHYKNLNRSYIIQTKQSLKVAVNLFTRLLRFGKSLNMNMFKTFFEIGADATLFEGLDISRETELCEQHMGKYPVISLSLKDVEGGTYEAALKMMSGIIKQEGSDFA